MFAFSLKHSITKNIGKMTDTILFRALFSIGPICDCLPKPLKNSQNRALYYAIILAALALNFMIYCADGAMESAQKSQKQAIAFWKTEFRMELKIKPHHFVTIALLALGYFLLQYF